MILVTTTNAFWVLDPSSGKAWQIDGGNGVYYGISFDENCCYVACRQTPLGAERDPQDNAILCFDRTLRLTNILRAPARIRDVHQIICHEGTLYICSTYDDAIVTYALNEKIWGVWRPFGAPRSELERDRFHINSISFSDSGVLLAGNKPYGWFARFDRQVRTANGGRSPLGDGTHNVWEEHGVVHVCSSNEGAIAASDGSVKRIGSKVWLRGVCQGPHVRYLGISQNLRDSAKRARSDCSIVALDGQGAILRVYSFRGFGMLHDIRFLGAADYTHNAAAFRIADDALGAGFSAYQTDGIVVDGS